MSEAGRDLFAFWKIVAFWKMTPFLPKQVGSSFTFLWVATTPQSEINKWVRDHEVALHGMFGADPKVWIEYQSHSAPSTTGRKMMPNLPKLREDDAGDDL